MNIEEFNKNIENTIEKRGLTPTPKWYFSTKNYIVWLFAVITTFLGSLAVTTIIFILEDHDWDVFVYLDRTLFEHIFISIPYIWILVLALLTFVVHYDITHTRNGYKYKTSVVLLGSICSSIILGGILFSFGVDSEIHELFLSQVPAYRKSIYTKDDIWIFPEKGLLSGTINKIDIGEIDINDINNKPWKVKITEETTIQSNSDLETGEKIKIIGKQQTANEFSALIIRPWEKSNERK